MSRTVLSAAQLYSVLDREFSSLRPERCRRCRTPLPYWRSPPDDVSANWNIGTPLDCPQGCQVVIAELVTRLWAQYDMQPERPQ